MKTSAPEQGAQIASKPTAPLRARKSAALSSKRFWQADSDLGEFFKYKSDKGKVSRRTTKPQPFSFMLREEQKKKAREAKEQAAKQNMVSDGDIVFNAKPVASTSTAAIDRLAQPKKKASVEQEAKKEQRRVAKARRTTRALSPKFRTAARAASRKFPVATENKPEQKEDAKKLVKISWKAFLYLFLDQH